MRFNSPEEVVAWATQAAADDIARHREKGYDLNPFSTAGGRADWQRGFDNAGPRPYELGVEWCTKYQRGRACAVLLNAELIGELVKETHES